MYIIYVGKISCDKSLISFHSMKTYLERNNMEKDKDQIKKEMDKLAMERVIQEKMAYKRKLLAEMYSRTS